MSFAKSMTAACVLLAAVGASSAPVPSRSIGAALEPVLGPRWEWAQGETVYLALTSKVDGAVRDLSGSTCYGILYAGTTTYWQITGTVASATGGVFTLEVSTTNSNVSETNAYSLAFYSGGTTSAAFLGQAEVSVLYAPGAGGSRAADGIAFYATNTNLWEDLRFPAQSLNPAGTSSGADLVATWGPSSNLLAAGFEDGKTDVTFAQAQIPHDWMNKGGWLIAHAHVSPHTTTTGHVVLACIYSQAGIGASFQTPVTTLSTNAIYATNRWQHLLWSWPALPATNCLTLSSMVPIRIERRATDARDTYAETLHMLEFDLHYQTKVSPDVYQP